LIISSFFKSPSFDHFGRPVIPCYAPIKAPNNRAPFATFSPPAFAFAKIAYSGESANLYAINNKAGKLESI
jgi:hypothetical protein